MCLLTEAPILDQEDKMFTIIQPSVACKDRALSMSVAAI